LQEAAKGSSKIDFFAKVKPRTVSRDICAPSLDHPVATVSQPSVIFSQDPPTPESSLTNKTISSTDSPLLNEPPSDKLANSIVDEREAAEWLNPTIDDESEASITVLTSINKLIADAKKFKAFSSLINLHAVKRFIELRDKYKSLPKVQDPTLRASSVVSRSIGKGPYFAHKIRQFHKYIKQFCTLPPVTAGKHHAHPSLLNNESINGTVRRYLTVLANGEVSLIYFFTLSTLDILLYLKDNTFETHASGP